MQKYKILKAIHNSVKATHTPTAFFKHAKIQNFESDSQLELAKQYGLYGFLSMQKYKILKAIHNRHTANRPRCKVF